MDIETIKEIVRRKPLVFIIIFLVYLGIVAFLKWTIHPTMGTVAFLVGGLLGVYFLDIAEVFFHLTPSPFRSIVFSAALALVALFIVTSSGSVLASGLVLSLYLTLLLWQIGEWGVAKNLNSWYRMVVGPVSVQTQHLLLIVFAGMFLVETILFIR